MNARKHLAAALVGLALLTVAFIAPAAAQADFGVEPGSLSAVATEKDGTRDFQAGSHPFKFTVSFKMNNKAGPGGPEPEGILRTLDVDLPAGLVGNPQTIPECPSANFVGHTSICPGDTQIGVARVLISPSVLVIAPINLMRAPLGVPARFGFGVLGYNSFQEARVRSDGDYGITVSDFSIPSVPILSVTEEFWGVPAASSHDSERLCLEGMSIVEGCASEAPPAPFLSLPTSCTEVPKVKIGVESAENPGFFESEEIEITDEGGTPTPFDGCNALPFEPTLSSQPTTNLADSPTGLDFKLHIPQPPGVEQEAGAVETCSPGQWESEPTDFTYRWLRNGVPIPGETSSTYVVGEADASSVLQCEVSASNAFGAGHAASAPLLIEPAPVVAPPRAGQVKAEPEGFFEKNEGTVVCNPGTWQGEPSLSYRWFENGAEVPGATSDKYVPAQEAFTLQCEVIGTNAGGTVVAFGPGRISAPSPENFLPSPRFAFPPKAGVDETALPLASAHLKDTTVTLPQGLTINPSVANGLAACSESEIGLIGTGFGAPNPIHFTKTPQSCPNASKIGTVSVGTPLLDHKVEGALYIAKPFANPFGSFMALYLVVEDEQTGTVAKLAGRVTPDSQTGQLTTVFTDNPQLPLEDIDLSLFGGAKAALKTPLACGTYTTTSTLVPWSTPEGQTVHPSDAFQTSVAAGGSGACPANEAQAPNKLSLDAGTVAPAAGVYSPFIFKLTRQDGTQRIKQIDTTLPKGLTGKLAGVPYCPESAIAQAISREAPNKGVVEQQSPSCPSASGIGSIIVGAGAGVTPYYTTGNAYLAGPYKGAPLSMVSITPAVAGPFDLGAVVVRIPLYVGSETGQIHAVSDDIPQIIQGVPLDVRSISLRLDRPSFTLNPTSCDPTEVTATAISSLGSPAPLSSPFQVGGCRALKFAPKLNITLKGGATRGKHPALRAVLTYPQGSNYANTASAQVTLPHAEFIDQSHFKTICTKVQFAADACPPGAIYGKATAITPLLDAPLSGPIYLRSSTHTLPDLVIAFKGQVEVDLVGKVDTGKTGGIRTTFESAPDAPVSKVILQMQGGKKGLLVNSENICKKEQRAIADLSAQNGRVSETRPLVRNGCKGKPKAKKKKSGKAGKAKGGKH